MKDKYNLIDYFNLLLAFNSKKKGKNVNSNQNYNSKTSSAWLLKSFQFYQLKLNIKL